MIIFTPLVLIPSKLYNFDDVTTARLGTILSALWTFPIFYICWQYLFSHRQALQRVPNHQSLWSAGVEKLCKTYEKTLTDLPAVRAFLLSCMFCEAANWSINTVAITYFKEYLVLSSKKIGLIVMTILIGGIPGTFFGKHLALYYDPLVSAKICLIVFTILIFLASIYLSPDNKDMAFLFGLFLGVCKGMYVSVMYLYYILDCGQYSDFLES